MPSHATHPFPNCRSATFSDLASVTAPASPAQHVATQSSKFFLQSKASLGQRSGCALIAGAVAITTVLQPSAVQAQGLPLIRDAEIEALLAEYARPIFRVAGLGGQNIKIRIVRSPVFNAFVVDGQNVFINTGTLMISKTPNQVIGVISHETGHITGGHIAKLRQRIAQDQTKSLLMKILGIGLLVAGGIAGGGSGGLGQAGQGVLVSGDALLIRSMLADRRAQESSADQAGLKFLTATKQSGKGMLQTFERFARQEYISDRHKDPFVRSHPVATQRLARLRQRAGNSPYFNKSDSASMQLRHDLMRAKLRGYLEPAATVMRRYRGKNDLPAKLARAIARNCSGNCARHIGDFDALIRAQPNNPYFWEMKGSLLRRGGRIKQSVAPLRRALKLLGNRSPLIKVELAQALVALRTRSSTDQAIRLLKSALRAQGHDAAVYRILGTAYYNKGLESQANLATARSRYHAGNIKDAKRFARRAKRGFKKGSREWLIADEIIKYKI